MKSNQSNTYNHSSPTKNSILLLQNGSIYEGNSFGHNIEESKKLHFGEICFNTSMCGYQEILTDPSYRRQIIVMTYPMIGNYGILEGENESESISVAGLIVKCYVDLRWEIGKKKRISLSKFLCQFKVPALYDVETRELVIEIRNEGVQNACIIHKSNYSEQTLQKLRALPPIERYDLVNEVTTKNDYCFNTQKSNCKYSVAVIDMGVKRRILEYLDQTGFRVKVYSARTDYKKIIEDACDAYFLSNGPGNPATMLDQIDLIKKLLKHGKPIFGICLGYQLIALAQGLKSYKLKFGHRGSNQPVRNETTQQVEITTQNHGYAIVAPEEKMKKDIIMNYINLNDSSSEGLVSNNGNVLCVQYHPEGSPGPHDAQHLFADFYRLVEVYYASKR